MMHQPHLGPQDLPWERRSGESTQAHQDFEEFLRQGPSRSYTRVAEARSRSYSLIRRYAKKFGWPERARAYDNAQTRDLEAERSAARREFAQRQEEEAWQLWRLGLALVYRFVRRDPDTGDWAIDDKLAPKDALALLKFVSELPGRLYQAPRGAEEGPAALELSWGAPGREAEGAAADQPGIRHPGLRRLLGLALAEDRVPTTPEEE